MKNRRIVTGEIIYQTIMLKLGNQFRRERSIFENIQMWLDDMEKT